MTTPDLKTYAEAARDGAQFLRDLHGRYLRGEASPEEARRAAKAACDQAPAMGSMSAEEALRLLPQVRVLSLLDATAAAGPFDTVIQTLGAQWGRGQRHWLDTDEKAGYQSSKATENQADRQSTGEFLLSAVWAPVRPVEGLNHLDVHAGVLDSLAAFAESPETRRSAFARLLPGRTRTNSQHPPPRTAPKAGADARPGNSRA